MKQKNAQSTELMQMQSFIQNQMSKDYRDAIEEELIIGKHLSLGLNLLLDEDIVSRVSEYGYPKNFVRNTLENKDMNDSGTIYYLLKKPSLARCSARMC